MSEDIKIYKENELSLRLTSELSIARELNEFFSFYVTDFKFHPKYKAGLWDGKIRLFNTNKRLLPMGLIVDLVKFCKKNNYTFWIDPKLKNINLEEEIEKFSSQFPRYTKRAPEGKYQFQADLVKQVLSMNKALVLSPTGCMDENTLIDVRIGDNWQRITLIELERLVSTGIYPQILTISGMEPIVDTYRKWGPGVKLVLDNRDELICSVRHLISKDCTWVAAEDLQVGDLISGTEITYKEFIPEQEWVDFTIAAPHCSYIHCGLIHHNSGKSNAIYLLLRFLLEHTSGDILITVPSLGLITQLQNDFKSYVNDSFDVSQHVDASNGAIALNSTKRVLITNWHAIVKQPQSFFNRFHSYICDEAHLADSASITSIVNKLLNSSFRYGFTGTLDGSKVNEMCLKGLFGPVVKTTTTKDLIKEDVLSELQINVQLLAYSKTTSKEFHNLCKTYQDEIDWLISSERRNDLIVKTALSQKHNTMVLFTRVEQHGMVLYKLALEDAEKYGKTVFIISGDTSGEKREEIRCFAQDNDNVVIFASYATTATGTNIPNLHTIIFAHPHKGRIRNLQSIGRGLRKHSTKEHATLIDFGDDLSGGGRKPNYSLKHLVERMDLYKNEGFQYFVERVDVET